MSKPTRDDKIAAIDRMLMSIRDNLRYARIEGFSTVYCAEIHIEIMRLEKRRERLLTPKPRKPKATATGIQIAGKTKNAKARNG